MKKSLVLTICLGVLLATVGTVHAIPLIWDVGAGGSGAGVTIAPFDGDTLTGVFDQVAFASQTSTIQYDDDGTPGFSVGDSFLDAGNLKVNDFLASGIVDDEGLNLLPFAGSGAYEATADWNNLTGTVTGITFDAGTGDTQVDLDYDTGTINFYVDTSLNSTFDNPGGTAPPSGAGGTGFADGTLVATMSVLDGVGHTFLDLAGGDLQNQGSVELLMEFTFMLDDFWLNMDGVDLLDLHPMSWNFFTTDMNIDTPNQDPGVPVGALWTAYSNQNGSGELTVIPEPSTMILLGCGLIGLAFVSRKRSRG